jgi:hypothetical protein
VPRSAAALAADLAALAELAGAADRAEIDELCRRLGAGMLRVLVVGEAKRGKSTPRAPAASTRTTPRPRERR